MTQAGLSPPEARCAAAEAAVFGFPLLLVDAIRRTHPIGVNRVFELPADGEPIAPGLGGEQPLVIAASAWLDLRDGPLTVEFPDVGKRHWSIALFDAHGRRVARPEGGRILPPNLIVATGEAAHEAGALHTPTDLVWLVIRIAALSEDDRDACLRLLSQIHARPATHDHTTPTLPQGRVDPPLQSPIELVPALQPHSFLHRLSQLLTRFPAAQEAPEAEALARLELGGDLPFQMPADPELKDAIRLGIADAIDGVRQARAAPPAIGWRALHEAADAGSASAVIAMLGAPASEDVLTLVCDGDGEGRRFLGTSAYELVFAPGEAPPVDAFWILTCAGGGAAAAIDSRRPIAVEPDGSVRIRVSQEPPPGTGNWLRSTAGKLQLRLSLYWPRAPALSGRWRPPAPRPAERRASLTTFANRGNQP